MAQLSEIERGKNFVVYKDSGGAKVIKLERVRLSFPAIGTMKENESEDGEKSLSYQATPMLNKETHVEAKDAFKRIMNELLKENECLKMEPQYKCLKDGDQKEREEYAGHWIITASDKKTRPTARNEAGQVMLDSTKIKDGPQMEKALQIIDEMFYPGAIVDVLLRPWFFGGKAKGKTKTYPKRVCCGIAAIKFVEDDGVRFSKGQIDDSDVWDTDGSSGGSSGMDDDDDGL